ncbi:MAG: hypothetical protein IIZ41_03575 [Lachnospiraceae bacterium]|nr:hypothetical protein [Lachnospiraceae bacterium]
MEENNFEENTVNEEKINIENEPSGAKNETDSALSNEPEDSGNTASENHAKPEKKKPPYVLIGIAAGIVILFVLSFILIKRWEGSSEFYIDTSIDVSTETDDRVSLLPPELYKGSDDGETTVVIFGNDTFGDPSGGASVCKLIAANTKATVYDCTFPGSTMMSSTQKYPAEVNHPEDWYCLYWLWEAVQNGDLSMQHTAMEKMSDRIDTELYKEHLETLESIDFNDVDVILFAYDGHDYMAGYPYYLPGDLYTPHCMNGVLYGIAEKVSAHYPGIQMAFICPGYFYAKDRTGKTGGANVLKINGATLSDHILFMKQKTAEYGFSYVDDYFGVAINEDNWSDYLEENNPVPNMEGKKMIAAHVLNKVFKRIEPSKKK